ncbi:MAG TPA: hypothetical protein VGV37_03240 [Aliidongia sp.]|uniref:hypothetical protein n=1 Tax=Aliidongia sp. TaxID=1914230 RepID=UPI002DDDAC41|nr:hypothetical protein [Aliidongia sp.]HEV2673529.1 hypothetical protein [Aliidongia sp.]
MVRLQWIAARPLLFMLLVLARSAAADTLDSADEAFRAISYRQAWAGPLGQEQRWTNPATGHAGSVRAVKERLDTTTRQPCREIAETLVSDGRPATGYAVGCRGDDGAWRIVQASTTDATAKGVPGPVPADVIPYVAPADIATGGGTGDLSGLPAEIRILVPWRGGPGAPPPAPR